MSIKALLSKLCFTLGLNTAHDYDGIETDEDVEIYTKAVIREVEKLKAESKA